MKKPENLNCIGSKPVNGDERRLRDCQFKGRCYASWFAEAWPVLQHAGGLLNEVGYVVCGAGLVKSDEIELSV